MDCFSDSSFNAILRRIAEHTKQGNPMKRKTYDGPTAEEQLVSDLIELMERSDLPPWQKPWTGGNSGRHRNLITGHVYTGANPILLEMGAIMRGHHLPLWVGFGAAKSKGWQVKKGSKSVRILRPQLSKREQTDANGQPQTDPATGDTLISAWVSYKIVSLFNAADLTAPDDSLDLAIRSALGQVPQLAESERLDAAERVLEAWQVPTSFDGTLACYVPAQDRIVMPPAATFRSREAFCATWAHEQSHSTGHKSRLARDLNGSRTSNSYAREELIAELAAVLLCQRLEIGYDLQGHAAYLRHWAAVLKESPRALLKVLSAARQAADLICPDPAADSASLAD